VLTGKYNDVPRPIAKTTGLSGGPTDKRLNAVNTEKVNDRNLTIARVVVQVAKELGCSPSQVALAWLRTRPGSIVPIIGARLLDQIRDNLSCPDVRIPEEQLRRLEEASHIDLGFPHKFLEDPVMKNRLYGGLYADLVQHREP